MLATWDREIFFGDPAENQGRDPGDENEEDELIEKDDEEEEDFWIESDDEEDDWSNDDPFDDDFDDDEEDDGYGDDALLDYPPVESVDPPDYSQYLY